CSWCGKRRAARQRVCNAKEKRRSCARTVAHQFVSPEQALRVSANDEPVERPVFQRFSAVPGRYCPELVSPLRGRAGRAGRARWTEWASLASPALIGVRQAVRG